jgi:hypothetical protein
VWWHSSNWFRRWSDVYLYRIHFVVFYVSHAHFFMNRLCVRWCDCRWRCWWNMALSHPYWELHVLVWPSVAVLVCWRNMPLSDPYWEISVEVSFLLVFISRFESFTILYVQGSATLACWMDCPKFKCFFVHVCACRYKNRLWLNLVALIYYLLPFITHFSLIILLEASLSFPSEND